VQKAIKTRGYDIFICMGMFQGWRVGLQNRLGKFDSYTVCHLYGVDGEGCCLVVTIPTDGLAMYGVNKGSTPLYPSPFLYWKIRQMDSVSFRKCLNIIKTI